MIVVSLSSKRKHIKGLNLTSILLTLISLSIMSLSVETQLTTTLNLTGVDQFKKLDLPFIDLVIESKKPMKRSSRPRRLPPRNGSIFGIKTTSSRSKIDTTDVISADDFNIFFS